MIKEFKDPNNWIKHGIMGIVFMQLLKYSCWLSADMNAKTIPFSALADLYEESRNSFIGGVIVSMMIVAFFAFIVEWLETKISKGTEISVPDIIITAIVGGIWYTTPFGSNLTLTIIFAVFGILCGVWLFYKDKMFKR